MKKILIILTAAVLLTACGNTTVNDETAKRKQLQQYKQDLHTLEQQITALEKELNSAEKEEVIKVKATEVSPQKFENFIEVTGKVEAELDVDVSPESAGIIKEVFVTEGELVNKGDLMAKLNTDMLNSSLEEMEIQLDLARTNYERQKNLWDQNIGSEMQYLQAKNNKESLEKRINSINAQIALAEIRSPVSGVVDIVYQKKGNIGSPQVPFAKVININKIKIYGDISESYITKIHKGDKVKVRFPALNETINATINQIGNTIDPNNRTFRIRVNLNNVNERIKPNLISILSMRDYVNEEAIVVPSLFIKEDFKGHYTYIVQNEGTKNVARKIYVTPGVTNNNITEIVEGLSAGMKVVSQGYNQITDGTFVQIN
ncbi:efflux RND transporter periplasmic adaptor subunit [Prolixibacteraceae bacterium Z1-6]|uniref:Efflux RND transporter periplasmic adaptor subunit n=1 Tax=Draconibacterium aestuarii TaxID=2998507 RepID=A0A9X3J7N4_9BACT|nr:efflux RND transporter periplasmic adaptor subunit [Prolixibacteraceae bacterium Z1-6]